MKKRSKAEWQELIAEYKKSGERQEDWCKSKNINVYTFQNNIRLMSKEFRAKELRNKEPNQGVKWLPIPIEGNENPAARNETLEIKIEGFTIQAHLGFNEDIFLKVCKVLKQLC